MDDESTRIPGIKIAITYKKFIQQVVRKTCPDIETTLAIETNDEGIVTNTAPIFVIQKLQGRNSVLLPHFEFIFADFHESENDVIRYYDKSVSAAFFGSTTGGGLVTAHSVRDLSFPRLRSAVFFRNNRRVVLRLSNLVACTPEAEKLLREMGFGEGWRKFSEHFSHRFIISMDGNAGTCSRLTVGLKSNSVVLRYETNHLMHYSSHLIPWLHYIPIRSDSEIEAVLDWEQREPGRFQYIAEQGTRFFANYLTREQVSNYMGGLIRSYAQIFAPI